MTDTAGTPTEETPNEPRETTASAVAEFRTLLQRNLERLVKLQKDALDTLSQQTEDVAETVRNSSALKAAVGDAGMIERARVNMEAWIETQKNALDSIVKKSAETVEASTKLSGSFSQSIGVLNELFQRTAERTLEAQKTMLDFAAAQNKAVSEAVYRQSRNAEVPETGMAELMQHGIAVWIDTQKQFLDHAARMGKAAANLKF